MTWAVIRGYRASTLASVKPDVLQLWLKWLVGCKDGEERDPTGNVQMAADGAGADSLCRALVSSVLAVAPRCRRVEVFFE
jgi:hypothetical protein